MITVSGLTVEYGTHLVLDQVSLEVAAGEAVCLTGDNGVGKSTLLRCVAGLQAFEHGEISVGGLRPTDPRRWELLASTVDAPSWYPGLTVREHLDLIHLAHGVEDDEAIDRLLDTLGIAAAADAVPTTLSSGQRQRLALCAVLARPSRVLLLDEPEQRLDQHIRVDLAALLADYVAGGGTLLMASHDPVFAAATGARLVPVTGLPAPAPAPTDAVPPA